MLSVEHVTVRFGGFTALDEVSLEVSAEEIVAILGPSGSGKSTLLRVIAGLERPQLGQVRLEGVNLAGIPTHERGLGLMFQDYALFPHLDVEANVAFGLRMQKLAESTVAGRVREVLQWVGLEGFGSRSIDSLSGGEQQRVALARTVAPQPRLLMLDEPVGALDRSLRARLVPELARLLRELRVAALYVTHDQEEAFTIADRVVVMHGGRVRQVASPTELWRSPVNETVARFLALDTIVDVRVQRGTAATPWGAVPTNLSDGDHRVVVRPDGVMLSDDGPVIGQVAQSTFVAGRTQLVVRCLNHDLPVEISGRGPAIGSTVRITFSHDALHPLTAGA